MAVPKKRHSRSKVGRRRSHLALKAASLRVCGQCGGPVRAHRVCGQCGKKLSRVVGEKTLNKNSTTKK